MDDFNFVTSAANDFTSPCGLLDQYVRVCSFENECLTFMDGPMSRFCCPSASLPKKGGGGGGGGGVKWVLFRCPGFFSSINAHAGLLVDPH